jgi:uncharacterized protein (TIGR02246 family)
MSTISSRSAAVFAGLVAMLLAWAPLCPRISQAADVASDRDLCRRLWEGHLEAVRAAQPEGMAFAKEAVLVYPDMLELRGREAIHAHLAKAFAARKTLEAGFRIDSCEVVGARTYTFVTVDELAQEGTAPAARRHARYATVWEQQADQSWLIARSLVNYRKP